MKEAGATWSSLEAAAQDRVKWKQFVDVDAPHPERQKA